MDGKEREKKFTSYWIIYLALAIVIVLSSFFICVFDYQMINDTFGLYVPFMHIYLFVGAMFVSIILKIVFKKKISILILFLLVTAVVFSSQIFFQTSLDIDGFMYPLLDYNGPLYFLRIGDYDLDGISDIGHHPLEENITKNITYNPPNSSDSSVFISGIDYKVTAQSKGDNVGEVYDDSEKHLIVLDLDEDVYLLVSVNIRVYFQDTLMNTYFPDKIKFYTSNERGDKLNYITTNKVSSTCAELKLKDSFVKSQKDKLYIYYEMENIEK